MNKVHNQLPLYYSRNDLETNIYRVVAHTVSHNWNIFNMFESFIGSPGRTRYENQY